MKHLQIDQDMKTLWPATRVGCFQYKVQVEKKNEELWKFLKKDIFKKAKDAIFDYGINDIPNIRESRQAYKAFGKDPSRYRVSSEALIRRIGQGKGLYEVNTVVDVNNLISIQSGFSVGSYDAGKIGAELIFRVGRDNETYRIWSRQWNTGRNIWKNMPVQKISSAGLCKFPPTDSAR